MMSIMQHSQLQYILSKAMFFVVIGDSKNDFDFSLTVKPSIFCKTKNFLFFRLLSTV